MTTQHDKSSDESNTARDAQNAAGFTGRYTAGLRFIENTLVPNPLIASDPLARHLAGDRGLALARQELENLIADQGPGRHLRVPARSRLIDDLLAREVASLRNHTAQSCPGQPSPAPAYQHPGTAASAPGAPCQVVSLGAGMCTRPWRLAALAGCAVFELDLPHITATKLRLLVDAGAETDRGGVQRAQPAAGAAPTAVAGIKSGSSGDAGSASGGPASGALNTTVAVAVPTTPPDAGPSSASTLASVTTSCAGVGANGGFPLLAASYACLGLDLSAGSPLPALAAALTGRGFDHSRPTVWVLEALLYYLPLGAASELLCALADLSAPGSRLIATCVDRELLEASLQGVPKNHVFADLWHFEAKALLYDTAAFTARWQLDWSQQPAAKEEQEDEEEAEAREERVTTDEAEGDQGSGTAQSEGQETEGGSEVAGGGVRGQARQRPRLPASTRRLAREWLSAETYVALYGGSELLFTAGLRRSR